MGSANFRPQGGVGGVQYVFTGIAGSVIIMIYAYSICDAMQFHIPKGDTLILKLELHTTYGR